MTNTVSMNSGLITQSIKTKIVMYITLVISILVLVFITIDYQNIDLEVKELQRRDLGETSRVIDEFENAFHSATIKSSGEVILGGLGADVEIIGEPLRLPESVDVRTTKTWMGNHLLKGTSPQSFISNPSNSKHTYKEEMSLYSSMFYIDPYGFTRVGNGKANAEKAKQWDDDFFYEYREDYYIVAMAGYYTQLLIGSTLQITVKDSTGTENTYNVIIGDAKKVSESDSNAMYHAKTETGAVYTSPNMLEFIMGTSIYSTGSSYSQLSKLWNDNGSSAGSVQKFKIGDYLPFSGEITKVVRTYDRNIYGADKVIPAISTLNKWAKNNRAMTDFKVKAKAELPSSALDETVFDFYAMKEKGGNN